jgi:hypothetical protein
MNGGPEKRNGGARREASGTGKKTKAMRNVRATGGKVEATRQEAAVESTGNTEKPDPVKVDSGSAANADGVDNPGTGTTEKPKVTKLTDATGIPALGTLTRGTSL